MTYNGAKETIRLEVLEVERRFKDEQDRKIKSLMTEMADRLPPDNFNFQSFGEQLTVLDSF